LLCPSGAGPAGFWFSACESNFAFWHSGRFPSVFLASRVCAGYRQFLYSGKALETRVYVGATAKSNAKAIANAVTPVFVISFRILLVRILRNYNIIAVYGYD
jgi:formate-dependent nitrite reductase membrane component NrfD